MPAPIHKRYALCLLAALLAATPAYADTATGHGAHEYRVTISANLERMRVEAHFAAAVTGLAARDRDAGAYLVTALDCDTGNRLRNDGRRLLLPADGTRCLDYTVDLGRAAARERRNRDLAAVNIALSPASWLWRPPLTAKAPIELHFSLPDGLRVAVPWQPADADGRHYVLQASPQSAQAPAIFGRFDYAELPVAGAMLRVALPRSRYPANPDTMLAWLEAAATDVSLAYGRFPNPSPLVVVIPVSPESRRRSSAVPFGRVIRDGGEAIELFVEAGRPLGDYLGDWTATHEFSHLMLPYLERNARWISEGFAQYYQNVLLARSGTYDRATAWQKIRAGLARGEASRPELSPNEAAARRRHGARMKIYWSGAALALLADVELRRRSEGAETLDDVLEALQACCLPSRRAWGGRELLERLDALLDEPVFMPLYEAHADTPGFPDTREIFADLGITERAGAVVFDADARLAQIRDDITRPDAGISAWRRGLAAD